MKIKKLLASQRAIALLTLVVLFLFFTLFGKNFCLTDLKSAYVDLLEKPTGRYIRLYRENFPYTVFWSKPGKMRFMCIEPWSGLGDKTDSTYHLRDKDGILTLKPKETAVHLLRMEFGKDR